jgi:hypothetical protein
MKLLRVPLQQLHFIRMNNDLLALAQAFERSADWLDKGVLTGSKRTHPLVGTADYRRAVSACRMAEEYQAWIDFYHSGSGDYGDFMRQRHD